VYCPKQEPLVQKMSAATAVFYCNKIYSGKNLFLPAKKLFLPVRFFPWKKPVFHLLAKTCQL